MKKIKIILCIIFGHKVMENESYKYCKRCGFGGFCDEYKVIEQLSK